MLRVHSQFTHTHMSWSCEVWLGEGRPSFMITENRLKVVIEKFPRETKVKRRDEERGHIKVVLSVLLNKFYIQSSSVRKRVLEGSENAVTFGFENVIGGSPKIKKF